jgi:hypothetical protein
MSEFSGTEKGSSAGRGGDGGRETLPAATPAAAAAAAKGPELVPPGSAALPPPLSRGGGGNPGGRKPTWPLTAALEASRVFAPLGPSGMPGGCPPAVAPLT